MLGLDVDMEADLGIDSIKRVEILAAATQALQPHSTEPTAVSEERMEVLTRRSGPCGALDRGIPRRWTPPPATATPRSRPPQQPRRRTSRPRHPTQPPPRCPVSSPPSWTPRSAPPTTALWGVVAITDDGQGAATALAGSLRGQGIDVALIRHRSGPLDIGPDGYAASLDDAQATRGLIDAVRQRQGSISTLVHLLPLCVGPAFEALDVGDQQARVDLEARSLLHLAQATSADLADLAW